MKTYALNNDEIKQIYFDRFILRILLIIAMLLFIFVFLIPIISYGDNIKNLGKFGKTYHIAEPDALVEIQTQAQKTNWNKAINKEQVKNRVENFKPTNFNPLPKAQSNNKFLVDMTYIAEFDVKDNKGNIIYPKGYSFNPLDYIIYPNTLIVINGDDDNQTRWFEKSAYFNDYKTKILLSDGSYADLSKKWERPVYYLTQKIAKRLKLKAVPSVIKQEKKMMAVKEIKIDEKNNK